MKHITRLLVVPAVAVALTASGATNVLAQEKETPRTAAVAPTAPDGVRGTVVSADPLRTLTAEEVATELAGDEDGAWDTGAVRYGLDTFRIVYRTVDPHGRPTTASGVLALPRSGERRLRTVSFTHGTELFKRDVASVSTSVWDQAPALTYASAGFAAVLPDYLGLGLGPGPHPWMDVPSETTAALDMLRASRAVAAAQKRELRREVLVTGFSQGASAALGLARSLQDGADGWFRLRAVAPISGAYAFRDAELPALLSGRTEPKASVIYAALTLVAFDRLHHLYDTPAQVFRAPYDRTIEGLLDGTHSGPEVVAGTPDSLDALLTPRGRAMLAHPTGRLAAALRVADGVCADWAPRVPIRLYYADADEQAVTENTAHCHAALRARGVDVPLVGLGTPDYGGSRHLGSQQKGTAAVVRWFRSLS
ncbi:S9 family peptidase [Streptomyces sp. A012304]|uniref:alpha/beta hydrolase family protein n=1 Tax=Streptomyces sp. A012304 TaxID=375446 RepID=UPI002230BEAC|nr:lipase [Streptomyces sp. A012304]GKQ40533.1 lipase [Streptomyces sp. A012304]